MDLEIKVDNKQLEIDNIKFQKMVFLYNALDNGWSIKKRKDSYILQKIMNKKRSICRRIPFFIYEGKFKY